MDEYIVSDLYRYTGKKTVGVAIKQFLINRAFRIQVYIRLSSRGGYTDKSQKFCTMPADIFIPIFKLVTGAELDTASI